MLTQIFSRAFILVLALLLAGLLAGCRPPGPKALVEGQRRLEQGDWVRAVERLETATRLMSTNAHAWNYLGIAYHQSGDASKAERAYQSALKADRNLLEARLNLGNLLLENGRAADAKSEFTAYTLRRPTAAEGFERLAAAELRLRELATAEAHARKAMELDKNSVAALNTLGLVSQQRGRFQEAAQCFTAALRLQSSHAPALLNLAVVAHRHLGDREAAVKWYRQYLALKPPPEDAAAVAAVVKQLELELAPPPVAPPVIPSTAAPSKLAPASAAIPSNPVPAASLTARPVAPVASNSTTKPPSPPATGVASTARTVSKLVAEPSSSASRRPEPPPTVTRVERPEVVTLPPEPAIRTEPDRSGAGSSPSASRAPATMAGDNSAKESRGFLESVNPLRLFRREPRPANKLTPLPAAEIPPSEIVVVSSPPPAVVVTPTAAPSPATARLPTGFRRYEYGTSIAVGSGDRSRAEVLLSQGNAAMKTRNLGEAVNAFRDAAQVDPGWYQAHFNHAAAALEAGRVEEALSAGETAVALRPDSADARYNFALALRQGNYVADAVAQLEKLLTMEPEDVRAHLTLGNLYADPLRLKDKARAHYQKVLKLSPRHPQAQAIRYWLTSNPR